MFLTNIFRRYRVQRGEVLKTYHLRIGRMNTNKINKRRKKKTGTNKQTDKKNQKQKLVNPFANFKAQALLLDEE